MFWLRNEMRNELNSLHAYAPPIEAIPPYCWARTLWPRNPPN
jgi:hypothetical protein